MAHPCSTQEVLGLLLGTHDKPGLAASGDDSGVPDIDSVPEPAKTSFVHALGAQHNAVTGSTGQSVQQGGLSLLCAWFVAVCCPVLGMQLNPASVASVVRQAHE